MTKDEQKAVSFLAILLLLSIIARVINRPDPITIQAAPIDVQALQQAGRKLAQETQRATVGRSRRPEPGRPVTPTYVGPPRPLDLNRASLAEIDGLPGIGPAVAARIVARRDSLGRFRSIEELDSVKGIGPALLEKLRPLVAIR